MQEQHEPLPDTPLALALRHMNMTQGELAARVGTDQPAISRAVRHCRLSIGLALRILDEIDPAREHIDERHILLARSRPELYGRWSPPAPPQG